LCSAFVQCGAPVDPLLSQDKTHHPYGADIAAAYQQGYYDHRDGNPYSIPGPVGNALRKLEDMSEGEDENGYDDDAEEPETEDLHGGTAGTRGTDHCSEWSVVAGWKRRTPTAQSSSKQRSVRLTNHDTDRAKPRSVARV
jgi:hypothetical protein